MEGAKIISYYCHCPSGCLALTVSEPCTHFFLPANYKHQNSISFHCLVQLYPIYIQFWVVCTVLCLAMRAGCQGWKWSPRKGQAPPELFTHRLVQLIHVYIQFWVVCTVLSLQLWGRLWGLQVKSAKRPGPSWAVHVHVSLHMCGVWVVCSLVSVAVREAVRAANEVHKKASSLLSCSCSCIPAYMWVLSHVQSCVCSCEGGCQGCKWSPQKGQLPPELFMFMHPCIHVGFESCAVLCL